MNLLCFDVSSGGISAALFDSQLVTQSFAEVRWAFEIDSDGTATLTASAVLDTFRSVIRQIRFTGQERIEIISIDTFLHSCLLLYSGGDHPLTPIFTWLDHRGEDGVEFIRSSIPDFYQRTGCRFHPMFPVFKLASLRLAQSPAILAANRIVSVKSLLVHELTGQWVEDHGTASASGLFNIQEGQWDDEILDLIGFASDSLPNIRSRSEVIGKVCGEFGRLKGVPVLNGTGDGFTAHVGSGCETAGRISVTLGTSAAVRQTIAEPALESASGIFCYMADEGQYLLGCAGSNGGNVLDWGRAVLKTSTEAVASVDPPIFIPLLNGERSPDWDPNLTGSWHLLNARHTAADLSRSILEGVVFNLAHFLEIVQNVSGYRAVELVLSGNGFLDPLSAPILAAVSGAVLSIPEKPGVMSLRGAGVLGLRSLGQPIPALMTRQIEPLKDPRILDRYTEYRRFRGNLAPA